MYEDTVDYLGFLLSPTRLAMDPKKIRVILEWPEPKKVFNPFLAFVTSTDSSFPNTLIRSFR